MDTRQQITRAVVEYLTSTTACRTLIGKHHIATVHGLYLRVHTRGMPGAKEPKVQAQLVTLLRRATQGSQDGSPSLGEPP